MTVSPDTLTRAILSAIFLGMLCGGIVAQTKLPARVWPKIRLASALAMRVVTAGWLIAYCALIALCFAGQEFERAFRKEWKQWECS